ncbi:uncharacterized protein KY384_002791 [Bacidia gigantensis]|uniref:uncharacterized protein n=1 Tax=Bacidia gigantensis TaxID=2732470 RepID=UPI001D0566B0|nr:uncharacterized protein KY384_002791 [Bacidia gigantensis]KAG8532913.1 hypothetical protein KY384_002791 [Bacidia gigantensis]
MAQQMHLPASFELAFRRLKDQIDEDDARTFHSTTMKDVWDAAKHIERQLEQRRSLRGFNRIRPFLTGIEQYSNVVAVLCNQTPYLPFLWAPIKLFLQVALGYISALESLIDAYAMIGDAMPRFDRLSAALRDEPAFQHVIGLFYADILEFHRRAYKFFRRRAWTMVFGSLWKTFNFRFLGILENLRKHRNLIDSEANAINIAESRAFRTSQLDIISSWRAQRADEIDKEERNRLNTHIRETMAWLGATEIPEDVLTRIGKGKSVLCAKVIENIQAKAGMTVAFYFCHHNPPPNAITEVLGSISTQLLAANTNLAPFVLETFASNGLKPSRKALKEIISTLLDSLESVRLIVDGVDEWPQDEAAEVIDELLSLKTTTRFKILIASRRLSMISAKLGVKEAMRLEDHADDVNASISAFVGSSLGQLRERFNGSLVDELQRQILDKANLMFLWVKLILFTVESLHFDQDLQDIVEHFPEGLEAM